MIHRTVPVALSFALVTAAIGGGAAVAAATPSRAVLVVHTTSKQDVAVAATTQPGLAGISNTSSQPIFLVTPRHGAGRAALAHDLNAASARQLATDFTIADLLPAKTVTYLQLNRGTFYLADATRDTFTAASVATLKVAGSTVNATAPKGRPVSVTARGALSSPTSLPTSSVLSFANHSTKIEEFLLGRVANKVSTAALKAFLTKPSLEKILTLTDDSISLSGMLSPGRGAISRQHSAAGRYLLVAFTAPTTSDSPPRLTSRTVRLVTVK